MEYIVYPLMEALAVIIQRAVQLRRICLQYYPILERSARGNMVEVAVTFLRLHFIICFIRIHFILFAFANTISELKNKNFV